MVLLGAIVSYLGWADVTRNPPFCSGNSPSENCQDTYSFPFTVSLNYSGSWQLSYYGYHNGANYSSSSNSYTNGTFSGHGPTNESVTLSGRNNYGLTLCLLAQKMDSSNSTLSVIIDQFSNETSVPHGIVHLCVSGVP